MNGFSEAEILELRQGKAHYQKTLQKIEVVLMQRF